MEQGNQGCNLDVLRIFSGSSHPELAQEIATYLGCQVSTLKTSGFSNDNMFVQLGESVRAKKSLSSNRFAPT